MKFTDRLNAIIGGESSAPKKKSTANQFTPAINNITGKSPKRSGDNTKVIIGKANPKKKWNPKPGYTPSTGEGVGY